MSKAPIDIRSLARSHTESAINTLAGICSNGKSEAARVSASIALLERGWGKPAQPIEGTDGPPIQVRASKEQRDAAISAALRSDG